MRRPARKVSSPRESPEVTAEPEVLPLRGRREPRYEGQVRVSLPPAAAAAGRSAGGRRAAAYKPASRGTPAPRSAHVGLSAAASASAA